MRILFYDTQNYDYLSFQEALKNYPSVSITFLEHSINAQTAALAKGYDAVCAFVNSDLSRDVIAAIKKADVSLLLMRCAGFNNIDLSTAKDLGVRVMRVPAYAPEAVAEHAMALAMCVNRRIHKAYIRVRENNFSLSGLTGIDFYRHTAGIIGTGKIGAAMCRICRGFGMRILAYDLYENPDVKSFVSYCSLDQLLSESDLISLHCPLTDDSYHLIDAETIGKMKPGVIFVNTSRGGLVNTTDLIAGIRGKKIGAVGLDVYEEETRNVYANREDEILESSVTARLLSFPNVVITSHQGFLTDHALKEIAETTLRNAVSVEQGDPLTENCILL